MDKTPLETRKALNAKAVHNVLTQALEAIDKGTALPLDKVFLKNFILGISQFGSFLVDDVLKQVRPPRKYTPDERAEAVSIAFLVLSQQYAARRDMERKWKEEDGTEYGKDSQVSTPSLLGPDGRPIYG